MSEYEAKKASPEDSAESRAFHREKASCLQEANKILEHIHLFRYGQHKATEDLLARRISQEQVAGRSL